MRQQWNDLFYLHWEVPIKYFNGRIPDGVILDTFQGKAHIAVVGLEMSHVRPALLPYNLNFFNLCELNLRTNVVGIDGTAGVFFFTLESDSFLANYYARIFYKLPYAYSNFEFSRDINNYSFSGTKNKHYSFNYEFQVSEEKRLAEDDEFDRYLLERYTFYTEKDGGIFKGEIHHDPYNIQDLNLTSYSNDIFLSNKFKIPHNPPIHTCFVKRMDVETLRFQKIK